VKANKSGLLKLVKREPETVASMEVTKWLKAQTRWYFLWLY
jgi:hypothetical protein